MCDSIYEEKVFCVTVRLYVQTSMEVDKIVDLNEDQSHYCINVRRLRLNDEILLFNGKDGEFLSVISSINKKTIRLSIINKVKDFRSLTPLMLVFSPIKQDRLNFMIEKATELGVTHIKPIITEYTQIRKINRERLLKIAIEASEQSERLCIPYLFEVETFSHFLFDHDFIEWPLACAYERCQTKENTSLEKSTGLLIGPEGGFSNKEIAMIQKKMPIISFGQQILRSETAAIVGLDRIRSLNV
jgi:16S rRNA (uracil1498-N3)-methyltransferase